MESSDLARDEREEGNDPEGEARAARLLSTYRRWGSSWWSGRSLPRTCGLLLPRRHNLMEVTGTAETNRQTIPKECMPL